MTEWLLLAVAVLLIAANALFVAAEFAFVTADRATVERHAQAGDRRSEGLLKGLRTLSTQLSGAQLGITVTSLVVGFLAEPSLATLLRGPLGLTGLSDGAVTALSVTLALALATGFQMVFGELVPKNWAIAEPLRVGRAVAGAQRGFTAVAGPLIRFLNGTANRILRLMGIEPTEELASARSPQELASLVTRSGQQGTLDSRTAELIARSIDFGGRSAADVMTPRTRVRFVSADAPAGEVLALAAGSGHARFPVTGTGVDDVVGAVHFKHALAVPATDRTARPVRSIMASLPEVPETMHLDPLLGVLRDQGLQMAVVVDEYGGTAGIVTLEDLVEEIVGEIADEQDAPARRHHRAADGTWTLSGLLRPDEASRLIDLDLPEPRDTDTLGGLVTEHLGRFPQVGDTITVSAADRSHPDSDGLPSPAGAELTVIRLDGRRVDRLTLRRVDAPNHRPAEEDFS
ncbi:Hemolysin, contains CBS domains [Micromonospora phaseoli]|uniref:Hemolysin, contains CBS domains n=1 Tax=Micromonospora phaseoli TaxID=1144548 RepID=A0A1H7DSF5_9ACTN|nr:hemolysin family protein [Micromonospora phaseoli]PZV99168.1 CBS domain containing-hemolysin-like protein [Micromonospora phaseoli]GIJ80035.1 membrane protein [Micromonospora phaseoli]SEK04673.1 Hemolysin, contains CBS domains [Micromonospora phaseoli]